MPAGTESSAGRWVRSTRLVPESMARIQWPGVVFKSLRDAPSANLYVAYGVGNAPDPLRAFIQVLNKPFRPD